MKVKKQKNTGSGIEVSLSAEKKPKEFKDYSQVCLDFGRLVNDEVTSDIVLLVKDSPPVFAHSIILKMRSPKLKKELSSETKEYKISEEHGKKKKIKKRIPNCFRSC
jgi:hypothetical protein